jgi:hypothetical protein
MSLLFRVVNLRDIAPQVIELSKKHYEEASIFKGIVPLELKLNVYAALEASNECIVIAAYSLDHKLVGYAGVVQAVNPHHQGVVLGIIQVIFLLKAYRKGSAGLRFIRFCERVAKVKGCTHMSILVPRKQQRVQKAFIGLGYGVQEVSLMRKL